MASSLPNDVSRGEPVELSEADLAQAFKELQKGEKTAQALEANLTNLEKKIDDLLASFEESERLKVEEANANLKQVGSEKDGGGSADGDTRKS